MFTQKAVEQVAGCLEFGQLTEDETSKSTPNFGKRDLRDEHLQIPMVQEQLDGDGWMDGLVG